MVFFHRHWHFTWQQRKRETILFPPHKHSDIYFQICMWDDYYLFLICMTSNDQTQQDLPTWGIIIWLIDDKMLISVWMLDNVVLGFRYSNLTQESDGFEPVSTTLLILQANRLTKCASHPIWDPIYRPYCARHPDHRRHINIEKISNVYRGKLQKNPQK